MQAGQRFCVRDGAGVIGCFVSGECREGTGCGEDGDAED